MILNGLFSLYKEKQASEPKLHRLIISYVDGSIWKSIPKSHESHHCDTRILRFLVPNQAAFMEADKGVAPQISCSKLIR